MSSALVSFVALKTSSSTIGPAGLESTCGQVWSAWSRLNTTVVSSGVSMLLRLASSDCGPFSLLIFSSRSNENFTSLEVSLLPFANSSPSLRVTSYVVGFVNSAFVAMSGSTSGLPTGVFIRNGKTWFCTAKEPLS